jgi:hypothetical protein
LQEGFVLVVLEQLENGGGVVEAGLPAGELAEASFVVAQLLQGVLGLGLVIPKVGLGGDLL